MPIVNTPRLILAAYLLLSAHVHAEPITLQVAQIKALAIETAFAGNGGGFSGSGHAARVLVPNSQMRVVSAPLEGMIDQLLVAPGMAVRKGQVLAYLNSPQAIALQRDALQADSQSALLQNNLKRDEQLFAEGLIGESRLQATRSQAVQAAAQAGERRQGMAMAGLQAGKLGGPLALVSPIDGVVLEQGVQTGQRVETATAIYRIARLSPLLLEIQAPLAIAATLRAGMSVKVVSLPIEGKLLAVGRAVDPASQTVLLQATVNKGAEQLFPGQMLEVDLGSAAMTGTRLPASAIIRHDGKDIAFVRSSASKEQAGFEARTLRVLSRNGKDAQVNGVQPGEIVVIHGASALKALLAGVGTE